MEPKVTLINWTPMPIETLCWARRVMHSPVPDSLDEFMLDPERWLGMSLEEYVEKVLLQDGMPTFLEFVHLTFLLENVSRSLTHQLVRNRIGFSYSQQSMRCVKLPEFANKKLYHMPKSVRSKKRFSDAMEKIQDLYVGLLDTESTEDARGILPMNIGTSIVVGCTFRAFAGMVSKRLCTKTQEEFKTVAEHMASEVENKMDARLLKWIGKPCDFGGCMMKAENEMQYRAGLLEGKQNTDHCCPIFVKKFKKGK